MDRSITNTKLILTSLLFLAAIAGIGYEWRYVWPARACEDKGAWWDPKDRQCLSPMPIWRITNRPSANPPAKPH
jgi:hypothetical protein